MDLQTNGRLAVLAVRAIRHLPPLRWLAYVARSYTMVLAIKDKAGR